MLPTCKLPKYRYNVSTQPFNSDRVLHLQYQDVTWDSSNKIQSRKDVDKSDNLEVLARIKRGSSWCIYEYDFIKQT